MRFSLAAALCLRLTPDLASALVVPGSSASAFFHLGRGDSSAVIPPTSCAQDIDSACQVMNVDFIKANDENKYCSALLPANRGTDPNWGIPTHNTASFAQFSKCTAGVFTGYKTCDEFCVGQGMVCVQGTDNDHHNELKLGTGTNDVSCVLWPLNSNSTVQNEIHNQTEAKNGCLQRWQTQICQCGIPLCTATPTPSPTPSPTVPTAALTPTPCDSASCTIEEDPHITVFDGARISMMGLSKRLHQVGLLTTQINEYDAGEYWLVFSDQVHIQAQYAYDAASAEAGIFVRTVAVGGPFLHRGTALIGCLAETVRWKGTEVLTSPTWDGGSAAFAAALSSEFDDGTVKMNQSSLGQVTAVFPSRVVLEVNRRYGHVNLKITMPQQVDGGHDGLCGNFNSFAGDDTAEMLLGRFDPRVRPVASLFHQAETSNL